MSPAKRLLYVIQHPDEDEGLLTPEELDRLQWEWTSPHNSYNRPDITTLHRVFFQAREAWGMDQDIERLTTDHQAAINYAGMDLVHYQELVADLHNVLNHILDVYHSEGNLNVIATQMARCAEHGLSLTLETINGGENIPC